MPVCNWTSPQETQENVTYPQAHVQLATYPVLLAISTCGNAVSIFVFRQEQPRTSKSVYLMALAFLEPGYMWLGSLTAVVKLVYGREHESSATTEEMTVYFSCLQDIAAFSIDWIIVAFSIDRLVAIATPLRHLSISSPRFSVQVVIILVLTACLVGSFRVSNEIWISVNTPSVDNVADEQDFTALQAQSPRPVAFRSVKEIYTFCIIFSPICTFFAILLLNGILVHVLALKRKRRLKKFDLSVTSNSSRSLKVTSENSTNLMLVGCVGMYLITQSPAVVLNILERLHAKCIRELPDHVTEASQPYKMLFLHLNYALNFVIYCAINRQFRTAVMKSFGYVSEKRYSRGTLSSNSGHSRASSKSLQPGRSKSDALRMNHEEAAFVVRTLSCTGPPELT